MTETLPQTPDYRQPPGAAQLALVEATRFGSWRLPGGRGAGQPPAGALGRAAAASVAPSVPQAAADAQTGPLDALPLGPPLGQRLLASLGPAQFGLDGLEYAPRPVAGDLDAIAGDQAAPAPAPGQEPLPLPDEVAQLALGVPVRLVTTTKSTSTVGQEPEKIAKSRRRRYEMLEAVRRLLPGERVQICTKHLTFGRTTAEVWRGTGTAAHYRGVATCGAVWICPVCAPRITEERRRELRAGISTWKSRRGQVAFVTWTAPHHLTDDLEVVLSRFLRATNRLKSGGAFKRLREYLGLVGSVRSLEITRGCNGWHVHTHEIWFLKPDGCDAKTSAWNLKDRAKACLLRRWQQACLKAGLEEPDAEHGLTIQDGSYADDYLSKWGAAEELTKSHIKRGKCGSLSAWGLLALATDGDRTAGALFRSFATCFKGRRQLFWSKGLRALLGLGEEKPDEDIAADGADAAAKPQCVATISRDAWRLIRRARWQPVVLEAVELAPAGAEQAVVDRLLVVLLQRERTSKVDEGRR